MVVMESTQTETQPNKKRPRSETKFPYYDLNNGLDLARAVRDQGGGECNLEQLARFTDTKSTGSGAFRSRISSAALFGLVTAGGGKVAITGRAQTILSPEYDEDAQWERVTAFLSVPLFKAIHDHYRGSPLPAEVGLKNALEHTFGVVKDRVAPTYRVFMSSGEQAGFFAMGKTHLVQPHIKPRDEKKREDREKPPSGPTPPGGAEPPAPPPPGVHTVLSGWLQLLPPDSQGWPREKFDTWIQGFTAAVKILHPIEDEKGVTPSE